MGAYAFISYGRGEDHSFSYANALAKHFRDEGIEAFIDTSGIPTGDVYQDKIKEAIRQCAAFVLIMTPAADKSKNVKRELRWAQKLNKSIIPLLLEGDEFFEVAELQYEDVTNRQMPTGEVMKRLERAIFWANAMNKARSRRNVIKRSRPDATKWFNP